MTATLKLFGLSPEEAHALKQRVQAEHFASAQIEELNVPRPGDELWVVSVNAAQAFLGAAPSSVPAILWVPRGKQPLPLEDWCDRFSAEFEESSNPDCHRLEQVSRCIRVLEWSERVDEIPAQWFSQLDGSPRRKPAESLPFSDEERRHLSQCEACTAEVFARLQQRAEMRWRMLCPSVDEISEWLKGGTDSRLETHVADCGLCQETVKRQATLWKGASLITGEQADAKLRAVEPVDWLRFSVGLLLLGGAFRLAAAVPRGARGETTISMEELKTYLAECKEVTLLGTAPDRWLHLRVEGDAVMLEVGTSPTEIFQVFRVEFRRGEEAVVIVLAEGGVARLTRTHLEDARQKQVDRLVILS